MSIVLFKPEVYFPDTVINNSDLEKLVDTSDEWILQRTGIKERRISLDLDVKDMGVKAAEKLLDREELFGSEIDGVCFATNWHDQNKEFPCHAGYVADKIGSEETTSFDLGAGCTGLVYALNLVYGHMLTNPDLKRFLVVGGERLTDMTDYSDRNTCVLFGDAVGAYLLERFEREEGMINNFLCGEPDVGDSEWKNGYLSLERKMGSKLMLLDGKQGDLFDANRKFGVRRVEQNYLVMNGKPVFKFATRVMRHAVHEVLKGTGYSLEDVDVIIPHGANKRIIDVADNGLRKKGFKGTIYTNLEKFGNTSTGSVPLAANEAHEKGLIKGGSLVVNVAFGAGFTYGANLYRAFPSGRNA